MALSLRNVRGILLAACAALLFSVPMAGQKPQPQVSYPPAGLLGVAWYPEQWPEPRWDADLGLMEAAGVRMVRIGEFAWSRLEPQEGRYDFGWLERAVSKAAQHHMFVVMGTPTDAPPAWMTQKYPDIVREGESGRPDEHGNRRQFSYTSPRFRAISRGIAEQMVMRFGHNPAVVGWQIGNEFSLDSFDPSVRAAFQNWLKAKYKTLDALNEHWTTTYWSQTYSSWDQILPPRGNGNPGLMLEHRRFVSDVWRDFARNQIDAIRAHAAPSQFITINIGGLAWTDKWDHYTVTRDLDLASWDDYVGEGHVNPYKDGAMHDLIRGLKQKNFWVMEAQPGFVNWARVSNSLNRGEVRRMAWAAIGHGADAIAYWQWRSALNGQEQYHGVLVGPDGTPVPLYDEIRQIGREFAQASKSLEGTTPVSEVAILHSYDSRWAIDFQLHNKNYDQQEILLAYYRPLLNLAQSVDIVKPEAALTKYKLVVAPSLNMISDELGRHLLDYVRQGGHLVLGPRSGMKDEYNALDVRRQPGPLVDALGGRIEQFYALEKDVPVSGEWGKGKATIWAELASAKSPDTETVMRYGAANGWLDQQAAVITRRVGKGRITYIGAVLDPALMDSATQWMAKTSGVGPAFGAVPEGVEVCRRVGSDRQLFIVLNHTDHSVKVSLPRAMKSVLQENREVTEVELPVQGVEVLEERR